MAFREEMSGLMRGLQDSICNGLERMEHGRGGLARFHADLWEREGGGGGESRLLAGGAVLEKGGVNFSEVSGELSPEFAGKLPGSGLRFFATGMSLVLHPQNPHVPAVHANFRYIEHGEKAWFGGGSDLTPCYLYAEDGEHFHQVWREVCERHPEAAEYPRFRDWCDRYFYLPHRGERRGVGGIFFDYLYVEESEDSRRRAVADFVADAGNSFLDAYLPIAERRADMPFNVEQRHWQEIRRGRYVEFNLLYDRGTVFGLRTGGRTESILMSLPPTVRWDYAAEPEPATPEAALLQALRVPPPPEPQP